MKKIVTTLLLLGGAASVYAQGVIFTSDYNMPAFNIHIWSPNPANPSAEQTGNSPSTIAGNAAYNFTPDSPAGSTIYGGQLIGGSGMGVTSAPGFNNGDNFDVELYAAVGTVNTFSTSTFTPVQALGPLGDATLPANWAGIYQGGAIGALTLDGANGTIVVPVRTAVTLAIAAWYNNDGTLSSYAQALQTPGSILGISTLGTELTGGPIGGGVFVPPFLPTSATSIGGNPGISSFSLAIAVPEPSSIALGVMGALAFLMPPRAKRVRSSAGIFKGTKM